MHYQYTESGTNALLQLYRGDSGLKKEFFGGDDRPLLTIAWNEGPAQYALVDGVKHKLKQYDLILMIYSHTYHFERPEDIIAWRFNRDFYCIVDHDAEVSCVGFIFFGFPSPMTLSPDPATLRKVKLLLPVFVDEFETHDNIQGEMLRMLLKRLIIILTRLGKQQLLPKDTPVPEYDTVRQYSLLVEQNFREKHQVADYAELLFKSPKTLSNMFRKIGDKTPLQIIRERIALEGKRLLMYTDKPVSEIAYELGFRESAHFSRMFKSVTGNSPTALREVTE